jgi:hypothetical protein
VVQDFSWAISSTHHSKSLFEVMTVVATIALEQLLAQIPVTCRISLSNYHVWSEALSSLCGTVDFVWYRLSSKTSFVLLNVCVAWWKIRVCKLTNAIRITNIAQEATDMGAHNGRHGCHYVTTHEGQHGGGGAGCCILSRHCGRVCVRGRNVYEMIFASCAPTAH